MLVDALKLCQQRAELIRDAAAGGDIATAGLAADGLMFALEILTANIDMDRYIGSPAGTDTEKKPGPEQQEDWPDGVSDDDPNRETPEERRAREEMKDRGFFG